MNVVKEVAKTKEEALKLVLMKLNAQEAEVNYSYNELKGGLFKGISYECTGFLKVDVLDGVQEFLKNIIKGMGIDAKYEVGNKDDVVLIKIYSNNNSVIIGKNGRNLEALNILVKQYVKNFTLNGPNVILDVEDYKDKQNIKLEKLAKSVARNVIKTKIDAELDNMNSYDRRIVHNVLSNYKNVKSESVGEEPNRHIIIKYVEN